MTQPVTKMDLPINYFMTYDVNYIYDHKKFIKGVVVFKITLTTVAIGFGILQSKGKGFAFNEPLFLKLSSLYLLANDIPKCHLCLSTGYIYANYPLKKTSQLYYNYGKASYFKANCLNFIYNNYREAGYLKSNCFYIICN